MDNRYRLSHARLLFFILKRVQADDLPVLFVIWYQIPSHPDNI